MEIQIIDKKKLIFRIKNIEYRFVKPNLLYFDFGNFIEGRVKQSTLGWYLNNEFFSYNKLKNMITDNVQAIALYNADKQELMAIFARASYAVKYLFETMNEKNQRNVYRALGSKGRVEISDFDFPVAVRYASKEQIKLLEGKEFKIMGNYPVPHSKRFQIQ